MNSPYPFLSPLTEPAPRRNRDVTWGRILFQPPALNPRMIFDPLPFRTQVVEKRSRNRSSPGR
jgi:hypothetical protein